MTTGNLLDRPRLEPGMKIGMAVTRTDPDAPVALHLGKTRWLLVVDVPDEYELLRNEGLDGRGVARVFAARGCTDVIVRHVGPGAYAHLVAAGIRVWEGEPGESARANVLALWNGRLRPLLPEELPPRNARDARHVMH